MFVFVFLTSASGYSFVKFPLKITVKLCDPSARHADDSQWQSLRRHILFKFFSEPSYASN